MVAASFSEVEAARDCCVIWNVRNVCETNGWLWICVGMVIVILTVLFGLQSAEGDRRECCVETTNETSSNTMQDIQDPDCCVES